MIITKKYASESSPGTWHTCTLDTLTGIAKCSCRGFRVKREGKPSYCTHTTQIRAEGEKVPGLPIDLPAADVPTNGCPNVPMLAIALTKGQTIAPFMDGQWMLEEKIDGHRVIVRKVGSKLECWSRPKAGKVALVRMLPDHLRAAGLNLADGVYDGEVYRPGGKSSDVTKVEHQKALRLVFFDILACGSELLDARGLSFEDRHGMLAYACSECDANAITVSEAADVSQEALDAIFERGGEGAMLKRRASRYRDGARSADWVKVKRLGAITLTVTGYEAGSLGPYSKVLLAFDDGRKPTSLKTKNDAERAALAKDPDAYLGRRLVVEYTEITEAGALRHGRWDHWAAEGE